MNYRDLAAAMRRGAKMGPQHFHSMSNGTGGLCAMGAVAKGAVCESVFDHFAEVGERVAANPITGVRHNIFGNIILLNDTFRWTREQIADWLDTLEPVAARPSDAEYTRQFVEKMEHLSPTPATCPD